MRGLWLLATLAAVSGCRRGDGIERLQQGVCASPCPSLYTCNAGVCTQYCLQTCTGGSGSCSDDHQSCVQGCCQPVCDYGQCTSDNNCAGSRVCSRNDGVPGCCTDPPCSRAMCCDSHDCFDPQARTFSQCIAGTCSAMVSCSMFFADCDAVAGCETTIGTQTNCGDCGDNCNLKVKHVNSIRCEQLSSPLRLSCGYTSCDTSQYMDCDGDRTNGCEDMQIEVNYCGACNRPCSSSNVAVRSCAGGLCTSTCSSAQYGNCVKPVQPTPDDGCETDLYASTTYCGSCTRACSTTNVGVRSCTSPGVCNSTCASAQYGNCNQPTSGSPDDGCETNLYASITDCGACGRACATTPNVSARSCTTLGKCDSSCTAGFGNCVQPVSPDADDGCETDLNTTLLHCGLCGRACSSANVDVLACAAGKCTSTCSSAQYGNCTQPAQPTADNGCETDLNVTVAHCGQCGRACLGAGVANVATPACSGAVCSSSCAAGFGNCVRPTAGQGADDGCETNLNTNPSHCGACGRACDGSNVNGLACAGGLCTSTCQAGWANCSRPTGALADDGCETLLATSVSNCGACGTNCNTNVQHASGKLCAAGACDYASCDSGYADCDGNRANGCERPVSSDVTNCGGCNLACATPIAGTRTCANGQCGALCVLDASVALKSCPYDLGANCGQCCVDGDCTTPPDQCHNAQGSCVNRACSYALKSCPQIDCHSLPVCTLATGNCDSTPLTGGNCGGNACYVNATFGTCKDGTCVDKVTGLPLPLANCASTVACKIGLCDTTGNCALANVSDGTACDDKCRVNPVCMGGACTGAAKSCTTPLLCRVASCDPSSGACVDAPAPASTACTIDDPCRQNHACDATGACVGVPRADGSPCTIADCSTGGACLGGACVCPDQLDLSVAIAPDLGKKAQGKSGDCGVAGRARPSFALLSYFALFAYLLFRRRRAR